MAQHELIFHPMPVEDAIQMRDTAPFITGGTESRAAQRVMIAFIGTVLVAAALGIVMLEVALITGR
jgi:hypothetical protein